MKFFSANLKDLRELYTNSLEKALDMEQQIVKALPVMIESSTDPMLKQAFRTHLLESETHVSELKHLVGEMIGEPDTIKCKVLSALVSETNDIIKDAEDTAVRDAALIGAGQQVEHHEIAVYGTLRSWAELLDETEHVATLDKILYDEKHADSLLTSIASEINLRADQAPMTAAV